MSLPQAKVPFGPDDYLVWEQEQSGRNEYVDGEVFAMSGASDVHGTAAGNLFAALHGQLRGKPCRPFIADMKVRVEHTGQTYFYYPDLMLACAPDDRETYYRRSPCLLVEVLSPSTERIDRREKLFAYQAIPSLREYLLVDPDKRSVEIYRFGDPVRYETCTEGAFRLDCLDAEITLDEVYADAEAP